jgi:acyl dehydratase
MSTALCPASLELVCGPVSAVELALYGAASGDLNPLHLDEAVARSAGFDQPLVHGMLTMAYAARLFTQQFGSTAMLSLNTRFIGAAKRGDRIRLSAELTESNAHSALYTLRGATESGTEIVSGSARVRLQAPGSAITTRP